MSNKTELQNNNTEFQSNNADLQAILNTVNALPNATTGGLTQVYHAGTTAPDNTSLLWVDTANGLKYYNGSAWVAVPVAYAE